MTLCSQNRYATSTPHFEVYMYIYIYILKLQDFIIKSFFSCQLMDIIFDYNIIYYKFLLLILLSAIMIYKSESPIHSVLFLVLVFYFSSVTLFIFGADFLALSFIIIYVGAIAVLFLFVVMMLDLKKDESTSYFNLFFVLLSVFITFLEVFLILKKKFFNLDEVFIKFYSLMYPNLVDELSNIEVIAQSLYNYFLICFLLAGIVLLVAVIGSIVLTLDFNNKERYKSNSVVTTSRTYKKIVFFA